MRDSEAPPAGPLLSACRALARAMDDFDEAVCGALGLGRNDLRALNQLEGGALSPSDLARRLGLTRSAVTALIDRLVAAGWVTRTAVPRDRRAVAIELTPATWNDLARVYRPVGRQVQEVDAALSDDERAALVEGLARITATFDTTRDHLRGGLGARAVDP